MAFKTLLLVVLLAGIAFAGPLGSSSRGSNVPTECASECPVSTAEKLAFEPGKSYIYSYRSQSKIDLHGVRPQAESSMLLEAQVVFSWQSPCQVAVAIKNPTVNGQSDPIMSEQLSHKPLIATIKDGVVTEVCADREDHPSSLNMKKGIVSSIQNVLPKLTTSITNQTFVESDILGRCPTNYTVEERDSHYIVQKTKNHKQCSHQHASPAAQSATSWWQKSPAGPLRESHSQCSQIIRKSDKLVMSATCRDENEVAIPAPKNITASHYSVLSLKNIVQGSVSPAMNSARRTDLAFEAAAQPKTQQVVPKVKELLKKICSSTAKGAEKESASQVAKIIGLLNRVPEQTIKQLLSQIRQGAFCQKSQRLESIFLDAVAFVENGGAVDVMAEEVTSGRTSGGRTALYTMALHLAQKPCIHSVQAVSALFDSEQAPSAMVLAAGSLVRRYCKSNPECLQEAAVQQIHQKLSNQIGESQCAATASSQEQKNKVLTALKASGNAANISEPLERSILRCLETRQADQHVRAAAAEAFRHASCQRQPTSALLQTAQDPSENTEARISSYVAAVRCASKQQLQRLVSEISQESNTQVRSFVLSHLRNAQQSDAPYAQGLRYALASIIIPENYEQNLLKHSRNIDLSYYFPTLGVGAGIDASAVYVPGSYLPRQLKTNLTANLFGDVVNVGEFSLRAEDLESSLNAIFGPGGYLENKERSQIFTEVMSHLKSKSSNVFHQIKRRFNGQENNAHWSSASEQRQDSREGRSQTPKLDAFARILGQEVLFGSFAPNMRNIKFEDLAESALEEAERLIMAASDINSSQARAAQLNYESFVPTAQGIPLQFKVVITSVASMETQSQLTLENSKVKLSPCMSLDVNTFVGFSVAAKAGLRSRVQASMKPHGQIQLSLKDQRFEAVFDMPSKVKLVEVDFQTYMMAKLPAQQDRRIVPQGGYPQITKKGCSNALVSATGLEFCYDVSVPDYAQSSMFPLGDARIVLDLEKKNPQKPVWKISGKAKSQRDEHSEQSLELQLEAPGSPNPRKGEAEVEFKSSPQSKSIKVFARGSGQSQGRAAKVALQTMSSQHGGRATLSAYYSKQKEIAASDEVFSAQFQGGKERNEVQAKMDLKTKKQLAQYVDADIEVDVSTQLSQSHLPKSINIRKFEANLKVKDSFSTRNYIRKSSSAEGTKNSQALENSRENQKNNQAREKSSWNGESSSNTQYKFQSWTRTPSREVLKVSGTAQSRGEAAKETFESSLEMSVQTPSSGAQAEAKFAWNRQEKRALVRYQSRDSQRPSFLANISATKQSPSSSSTKALAQLEIPSMIPSFKVEGSAEQRQPGRYDVKLVAKKNEQEIYEVEGPVSAISDQQGYRAKTELSIRSKSDSQEHKLKSRVSWSPRRQDATVELQTNGHRTFAAEAEHECQSQSSQTTISLTIPKTIDAKLKAEQEASVSQIAFTGYLLPNTPDSQNVKASASMDTSQQQVKAMVAYNADKNPQNKIELNAHYDVNRQRQYASVKGDLNAYNSNYRYSAEAVMGALSNRQNSQNKIKVQVTKADGKEIDFETSCRISTEGSTKQVSYQGRYKCPEGKVYQIDSKFSCDSGCACAHSGCDCAQAQAKSALKGQATIQTPNSSPITFSLDSESEMREQQQNARWMIKVTGQDLRMPLQSEVEFSNSDQSLEARVDINLGSASKMSLKGRAQATKTEKAIRDGNFEVNVQVADNKKYQVQANKKSQDLDFSVSLDGQKILVLEQAQPQEGEWYARITTPSRMTEAHSQITANSVSVKMYPNRKESEKKYEASGHFRQSDSELDVGAKFQQPEGQKGVQANFAMEQDSVKGTLEIDIFRNPSDKIAIHVRSARTAPRSYRIETDVRIPTQNIQPRIEAEIALSPEAKAFEIQIKKSPSAKPSFKSELRLNTITEKNCNLYASLKTPSDKFEVTSNIQHHELQQCRGASASGTFTSRRHGQHQFQASACAPFYIEFGANSLSQNETFMFKAGMKNPASIKLALDKVYNSSQAITAESAQNMESTINLYGKHQYLPKKTIALIGAKLWTSTLVSLDVQYNATAAEEFQEAAQQAFQRARTVARELKQIPSQLKQEIFPSLPEVSPQLSQQLHKIREALADEAQFICKQLGVSLPSLESIKEAAENAIRDASRRCQKIQRAVERRLKNAVGVNFQDAHRALKNMDRQIQKQLRQAFEESKRIITALQDGSRQAMMQVSSLRWIIETAENCSIWDYFKAKFEELKEKFEAEWNAIEQTVRKYYNDVVNEAKKIWNSLMENTIIRRFIKWIESFLFQEIREDEPSLLQSAAQRMYSFSMSEKGALIRAQVPLRRPVASLSAAASSIGVSVPYSNHISRTWNRPSVIYRNVAQPFSSSATLGEQSLTTFDGLVVPVAYSNCEILLAKAFEDQVTARKPNAKQTEIKITLQSGKEIKIQLEAGKQPKVPEMRDAEHMQLQGAEITKTREGVKVQLKGMTVQTEGDKVEIRAKPWAFAGMEGLMGNHDNEKSNDAHQNAEFNYRQGSQQGPHHLTKESARKLMQQYRAQPSCNIPRH